MSFHPEPMLWTTADSARALEQARAAVFMVGSYDGSRNDGDVTQLQSAVDLVAEFTGVLALPVVELEFAESDRHAALRANGGFEPGRVLYFASYRDGSERDPTTDAELIPAVASPRLAAAATYLYGGGYLNAAWGERKLAMVRAVDALVRPAAARRPALVASGLQLDAEWLAGLAVDDRYDLARVGPLGVRDPESRAAAPALDGAAGLLTWDDALDLLATPADVAPNRGAELAVNLHVCVEEWVTDDGERLVEFIAALLDELARIDGRRLRVSPADRL